MTEINCREAILSNDYYDFLIAPEFLEEYVSPSQSCIQPIGRSASSVHLPRSLYPDLSVQNEYYSSIPKLYGLMEGTVTDQIRFIPQQEEDILGLTGEGVLLGFIGTGINYNSDYFKTRTGNTRILGIWDQTIQDGTPPPATNYGSAYSEQMINQALESDAPLTIVPSEDTHGYGTYLASVAAASENPSGSFHGVAPNASIGIVKLKEAKPYLKDFFAIRDDAIAYQENDILLAIKYLYELAEIYNMPLVICLGPGTSIGNHNSSSYLSSYIDEISVGSRCVVCGTGNEAASRHHFSATFGTNTDYIDVEIRVEDNQKGFWMELWGKAPDVFSVSVISPSGETLQRVPYRVGGGANYEFIFENSSLSVAYQVVGDYIGDPVITMRMLNPANGIWTFRIYGSNLTYGQFHMWLPINEFLEGSTYFLASNPDMTLTTPSSSVRSITVSAYDSGNNSIFLESGRGFTFSGLIKPYLAAPGVSVPGITLRDRIIRRSGTSESAALTAGSCALIFQWAVVLGNDTNLSVIRLSTLLIRGADRSVNRTYPNREWGFGTLNLANTFKNFRPI